MKNICFVVLTTYQLYVADIYSEYISNNYTECDLVIISVGLDTKNYSPKKGIKIFNIPDLNSSFMSRIWQRLYWGGRLFGFSPLKDVINKNDMVLFIFNDNEPITNKILREVKSNKNNRAVIIEEGIGIYSYSDTKKITFKKKLRWILTSILGSPMQYKAIGDNELIDYAIVGNKELYLSLAKSSRQKVLAQNKNNLFSCVENFLSRYLVDKIQVNKADFIYLGQPFGEFGQILDEEKECLIKLFSMIDSSKNIIIKPHPRDLNEKYDEIVDMFRNVSVIKGEMAKLPAECLVNAFGSNCVIAFNSSAGVNLANSFKHIKCIFLLKTELFKPIYKYWNKIGAVYDDSIFLSENNNTYIPRTEQALKKFLSMSEYSNDTITTHQQDNQFREIKEILYSKHIE